MGLAAVPCEPLYRAIGYCMPISGNQISDSCIYAAVPSALLLFWSWQQQHHVPQGEQGGQETRVRVQSVYIQGGRAVGVMRLQE